MPRSRATWPSRYAGTSTGRSRRSSVTPSARGNQLTAIRAVLNDPGGFDYPRLTALARALFPAFDAWWPRRSLDDAFGRDVSDRAAAGPRPAAAGDAAHGDDWMQKAEDMLAILLVQYVCILAPHVRLMVGLLTVGSILSLCAATLYPFQPQHLLSLSIWAFLLALAVVIVILIVQIDSDAFVSRVSRTVPNAVSTTLLSSRTWPST